MDKRAKTPRAKSTPPRANHRRIRLMRGSLDHHAEGVESRAAAWAVYLSIAPEIQPDVMDTLLTEEALTRELARRSSPQAPSAQQYRQTSNAKHIRAWCQRWRFRPEWAEGPASDTLRAAWQAQREGCPLPTALDLSSLTDNPPGTLLLTSTTTTPLHLDLPAFTWSPTSETFEEAKARIMGTIDAAVTQELERIRQNHLRQGFTPGRSKRSTIHFVWLARAWLLGESPDTIADELRGNDARDSRTVQRGIADARAALGLLRRPRSWRTRP